MRAAATEHADQSIPILVISATFASSASLR